MASIINAATSGGLVTTADTSGILQLQTASTTAVTVDASQNVGIGITSPSAPLNVQGEATGGLAIRLNGRSSDNYSELAFWNNANSTNYGILGADQAAMYFGTNASLPVLFTTGSTERARFNTTGALVFAGGTTTANGIGITFPATQSASSDANTLDDYEEGSFTVTFTPATSGTITLNASYQTFAYTKVGRLVTVTGELVVSSVSTPVGTSVSIGNLPFAASGASNAFASGFGILDLGTGGVVGARIPASSNYVDLRVNASTIGASYNIIVGFSYLT